MLFLALMQQKLSMQKILTVAAMRSLKYLKNIWNQKKRKIRESLMKILIFLLAQGTSLHAILLLYSLVLKEVTTIIIFHMIKILFLHIKIILLQTMNRNTC